MPRILIHTQCFEEIRVQSGNEGLVVIVTRLIFSVPLDLFTYQFSSPSLFLPLIFLGTASG